jgi:hypothetical protein
MEVVRGPSDGRVSRRFITELAFIGKYASRFHVERVSSATLTLTHRRFNHVVFDCHPYTAACSISPQFDFDDWKSRPTVARGVLRTFNRTSALLRFLESAKVCFRPRL